MEPAISVVIPTFRRPALLNKCLQALSRQSLSQEQYEVIVVSDGPDKDTAAAVQVWSSQGWPFGCRALAGKGGPAAARNAGWQQARGVLVAFTDDDCMPEPGWLQAILNHYKGEQYIAYSGRIIVPVCARPTDFERNTQGLERAAFVTANCVCTKAALQEVGGFDEAFTMAWREDSDLEFKLLQQAIPVIRLEAAVVVHPVREAPWGVSVKEQKKGMFNALLYKKYPRLYRQKIQSHPPFNYYAIIVAVVLFIVGMVFSRPWLSALGGTVWLLLTVEFIARRLAHASRSPKHVMEMIATSLVIPFSSVFWQVYGSYRYRVFFI